MTIIRRPFFYLVGVAIAVAALSQIVSAEAPSIQTLRLIVPCAAGTPADLVAHIIAKGMSETSGLPAYVENITAGAGPIDIDTAEKLLADGHSILFNLGDCGNEDGRPQATVSMK